MRLTTFAVDVSQTSAAGPPTVISRDPSGLNWASYAPLSAGSRSGIVRSGSFMSASEDAVVVRAQHDATAVAAERAECDVAEPGVADADELSLRRPVHARRPHVVEDGLPVAGDLDACRRLLRLRFVRAVDRTDGERLRAFG